MFALEDPVDELEKEQVKIDQKISAINNAAQLRDELFEGGQGSMIKVVGGVGLGLYFLYRFLFKR